VNYFRNVVNVSQTNITTVLGSNCSGLTSDGQPNNLTTFCQQPFAVFIYDLGHKTSDVVSWQHHCNTRHYWFDKSSDVKLSDPPNTCNHESLL